MDLIPSASEAVFSVVFLKYNLLTAEKTLKYNPLIPIQCSVWLHGQTLYLPLIHGHFKNMLLVILDCGIELDTESLCSYVTNSSHV